MLLLAALLLLPLRHLVLLILPPELLPVLLRHLCSLLVRLPQGLQYALLLPGLVALQYPVMLLQRHPFLVLLLLPVQVQISLFLLHQLWLPLQLQLYPIQQSHLRHAPRPVSRELLRKDSQLLLLLLVYMAHRQLLMWHTAMQQQHRLLFATS